MVDDRFAPLDKMFEDYVAKRLADPQLTSGVKNEAQSAFDCGIVFYSGGLRCVENRDLGNGTLDSAVLPGIVNFAFAAELFMKAALRGAGSKITGHQLGSLYPHIIASLRADTEKEYFDITGRNSSQFLSDLSVLSNSFVEWRYVFEGTSERFVRLHDIVNIAKSLYISIHRHHPEWAVLDYLDASISVKSQSYQRIGRFSNGEMVRVVSTDQ